jgi:hypothetical protein
VRTNPKPRWNPAKEKKNWFMTNAGKLINLDAVEYITESHINGRRWSVAISAEDYRAVCALLGFRLPAPTEDNPPSAKDNHPF